jgi:coenzyme F420-reducing hydrogenase alpha subunit
MSKTIKVDYLARVEGEGTMYVKVTGNKVVDAKLKIFEPPRFFEALLRGRSYAEAPDITARICGICPIAYQMSSVHAMENAFGVRVEGELRALRRLLYCGEWIESHALHVYMLHAPDFLGYEDAIQLAKDHPDVVKRGLRLKKIGNELVTALAGREIHPINVRVGGFYKLPTKQELLTLVESLTWARQAAEDTVRLVATFSFPEFERDYQYVALQHPDEYAMNEGRLVSNKGLNIAVAEYEEHFVEEHIEHSHALHSYLKGSGAYHVGPLARYNLNFDRLPPSVQQLAREVHAEPPYNNPFKSIVVRGLETVYACGEALRVIQNYKMPDRAVVEVRPRAGSGCGCTEAPRGILYHRYTLDDEGIILDAKITPPTAQNQKMIEEDLRQYVMAHLSTPQKELTWQLEQSIRNYDPCISCATHFLKFQVERT